MEVLAEKKVTIGTPILQDLVNKAINCCSFMGSVFPLTCVMEIKIQNNRLSVRTTDNVNTLILYTNIQANDFDIVVDAKLFSQLVAKITSPTITLVCTDTSLQVIGNGSYNLTLPQDPATSEAVKFNDIPEIQLENGNHITNAQVKSIMTLNKVCKADIKEVPSIYNYYMDDKHVITTDYFKACLNPVKLFNSPVCVSPTVVELIPLVCDDQGVLVHQQGENLVFSSSKGVLYAKMESLTDVEDFRADKIVEIFNEAYNYKCTINKTLLLNALDRICLFVSLFERNRVDVILTDKNITLHGSTSNSSETINYLQPIPVQEGEQIEVKLIMDGIFLKAMISAYLKEDITVKFGTDNGIELVCDQVVQTLGVLAEDEFEG